MIEDRVGFMLFGLIPITTGGNFIGFLQDYHLGGLNEY